MQILIFKKYDFKRYAPDGFRIDSFRMLGEFLWHLPNMGIELIIEWLLEDKDDFITEYFFRIKKSNGLITIYPDESEDENEIEPFRGSAEKIAKLAADFFQIIRNQDAVAIAIMYENENYYLKPFFSSIIAFRKLMKEEFNIPVGRYVTHSFENDNELAALGMFLESAPEIDDTIQWLESSELILKYKCGSLKKIEDEIIVEYKGPYSGRLFITTIKKHFLKKIIEYYHNFVNQKIESFLLIKTLEGYSFMINPHEEIKLTLY